jgi:prefoldin subunit 5
MNNEDAKADLAADLKKYQAEIVEVQKRLDTLEAQKNELFRLGARLEGVISYIKLKMEASVATKAPSGDNTDGSTGAV